MQQKCYISNILTLPYKLLTCKERVHSEMKIFEKMKLTSNIVTLAFFFCKSVSFSSDINITFRTCIFTSGTCITASGRPAFSPPGPALSLPGPALLLPDLNYFTVTFPSRKLKQTEGNEPNLHNQ